MDKLGAQILSLKEKLSSFTGCFTYIYRIAPNFRGNKFRDIVKIPQLTLFSR